MVGHSWLAGAGLPVLGKLSKLHAKVERAILNRCVPLGFLLGSSAERDLGVSTSTIRGGIQDEGSGVTGPDRSARFLGLRVFQVHPVDGYTGVSIG